MRPYIELEAFDMLRATGMRLLCCARNDKAERKGNPLRPGLKVAVTVFLRESGRNGASVRTVSARLGAQTEASALCPSHLRA